MQRLTGPRRGVGCRPSGSGQQSVTGVESSDDANSYWRIRGGSEGGCPRGSPVRCGQAVRLTHVLTGKNLHTHHFPSPLSNNQVSAGPKPTCAGGAGGGGVQGQNLDSSFQWLSASASSVKWAFQLKNVY